MFIVARYIDIVPRTIITKRSKITRCGRNLRIPGCEVVPWLLVVTRELELGEIG